MIQYNERRNQILRVMTYSSIVLFIAAMIMNFTYPGTEQTMGQVQRVFYIHLGSFFGSFVLFCVALVAGIQYLRTRDAKWDKLGAASVELGLGISAVNIVTGAIWARPIWGAYWTWDPRLTTVSIMWLTYAAYLFLRSAIEDPEQKQRFSAVYGILAFSSVLLTIMITRVRSDAIHPVVAGPSTTSADSLGDFNMTPRIAQTVLFNIFVFIFASVTLLWYRIRLENLSEILTARKMEILGRS